MAKIIKLTKENIEKATEEGADIIKKGGTVIFPTETVYGLGANALDENSAAKIYKAKGRPSDNPLIVHIASLQQVNQIGKDINQKAKLLIENFWPGPLTMIFNKKEIVPYKTTGGLDTVAIRFPNNQVALKLIKKSKLPIAAPSANISGKPSLTDEENLVREMKDKVDMIMLLDNSDIGLESTVIDLTSPRVTILRPGYIEKFDLERVLGEKVEIDLNLENKDKRPKSPGMKYKHYSPKCNIVVVTGNNYEIIEKIKKNLESNQIGKKDYIVLVREDFPYIENKHVVGKNNEDIAHNLFETFRDLDKKNMTRAYFPYLSDGRLNFAIMDRVKKAAAYNII